MTRSAHLLFLLCFLQPPLPDSYFFLPLRFLPYLLFALSIVSHLSSVVVLLCLILWAFHTFYITCHLCALLPLPCTVFTSQHPAPREDRDDFISGGTNNCRVTDPL